MTISLEQDLAEQIRREAKRDGVDVSTWMARTASQEATRRAYAATAEERREAGVHAPERQAAFAARRAAVRRYGLQQ